MNCESSSAPLSNAIARDATFAVVAESWYTAQPGEGITLGREPCAALRPNYAWPRHSPPTRPESLVSFLTYSDVPPFHWPTLRLKADIRWLRFSVLDRAYQDYVKVVPDESVFRNDFDTLPLVHRFRCPPPCLRINLRLRFDADRGDSEKRVVIAFNFDELLGRGRNPLTKIRTPV